LSKSNVILIWLSEAEELTDQWGSTPFMHVKLPLDTFDEQKCTQVITRIYKTDIETFNIQVRVVGQIIFKVNTKTLSMGRGTVKTF
jgi:hypothetical protein